MTTKEKRKKDKRNTLALTMSQLNAEKPAELRWSEAGTD